MLGSGVDINTFISSICKPIIQLSMQKVSETDIFGILPPNSATTHMRTFADFFLSSFQPSCRKKEPKITKNSECISRGRFPIIKCKNFCQQYAVQTPQCFCMLDDHKNCETRKTFMSPSVKAKMSENSHKTHTFRIICLWQAQLTANLILSPSCILPCHFCQGEIVENDLYLYERKRKDCQKGDAAERKCALALDWIKDSILFWLGFCSVCPLSGLLMWCPYWKRYRIIYVKT